MTARRDPTREILLFVGALAIGLTIYYVMRGRGTDLAASRAVDMARGFVVERGAPSLTEAIAAEHGVEQTAVEWRRLEPTGLPHLTRVAATVRRGEQSYEYRFDVDTQSGLVHPGNPRARRLMGRLRGERNIPDAPTD